MSAEFTPAIGQRRKGRRRDCTTCSQRIRCSPAGACPSWRPSRPPPPRSPSGTCRERTRFLDRGGCATWAADGRSMADDVDSCRPGCEGCEGGPEAAVLRAVLDDAHLDSTVDVLHERQPLVLGARAELHVALHVGRGRHQSGAQWGRVVHGGVYGRLICPDYPPPLTSERWPYTSYGPPRRPA